MAIITEEHDQQEPKPQEQQKGPANPHKTKPSARSRTNEQQSFGINPLSFWFYFTLSVSLITVLLLSISSLPPQDTKGRFLSLLLPLRQHYSRGRSIKVQTRPNQAPTEVFTVEEGSIESENVIIVHGLELGSHSYGQLIKSLGAKGVHVVALDLPGNGFSDKYTEEFVEGQVGVLGMFWYAYSEIQEKGIFLGV